MDTSNHLWSRAPLIALTAAFVLGWRIAALQFPSTVTDIDDAFRAPLALLGLLFLGCGLFSALRIRNEPATVFLIYCFGSAIHWGGSVGVPNAELQLAAVYIALSAAAGGALCHLALVFPQPLVSSATAKSALYIPAAVGLCLIPASIIAPAAAVQTLAGAALLLSSLLSLAAGVILMRQYLRQRAPERRRLKLDVVVFGGLGTSALALAGSSGLMPGPPDAWNLLFGILPVSLTLALTAGAEERCEHTHETEP